MALFICLLICLLTTLWGRPSSLHATPLPQAAEPTTARVPGHLYLLPGPNGSITLLTHTVDMGYLATGHEPLRLQVDAFYRLRSNRPPTPGTPPVAEPFLVRLSPQPPPGAAAASPATNVSVTVANRPLALQPNLDGGGFLAQLELVPGGSIDLRIRYELALPDTLLPTNRYAADQLRAWPGQLGSLRVSFDLPATMPVDSWLQAEPEGWKFDGQELRWLYEGRIPSGSFVFQVVHPALWQQIQEIRLAAQAGSSSRAYENLAQLYRQLYAAPAATAPTRATFYAQALAAYSAGLDNARTSGAHPTELATLHAGLASLYRGETVAANGTLRPHYVELMVQETQAALDQLTGVGDQPQRTELSRWLADGLRLQLVQARKQQDWSTAAVALERLAALPVDLVDPDLLARERRSINLQQAAQLLSQGDQAAAIALAGPEILQENLTVPSHALSLFQSWEMTVTVQLRGETAHTTLTLTGSPAPGRQHEVEAAAAQLTELWRSHRYATVALTDSAPHAAALQVTIALSDSTQRARLTQTLLPDAHWAALRTLLLQPDLAVEIRRSGFWRHLALQQPINLRPMADQWQAMAAQLERQASETTAAAQAVADSDLATEKLLTAQIRAANYRSAAQQWRSLATHSQILVTLAASERPDAQTRSWLLSAQSPPRTLLLAAQELNSRRLLAATALLLGTLLLLAGILWRLL